MSKTKKAVEVPRVEVDSPEVQSKLDVAHDTMIETLGREIIKAHGELGQQYYKLVMYIRHNKVSEGIVKVRLKALGFKKTRVSEVMRVSFASDKVFKDFEGKALSFRGALEMARVEDGKKPVETVAAKMLVEDTSLTASELGQGVSIETTPKDANGKETPTQTPSARIKSHAMAILKIGPSRKFARYISSDSAYEVIVRKMDATNPARLGADEE